MNNKILQREQVLLEMLYEKNEIIKQLTAQLEDLKKKLIALECKKGNENYEKSVDNNRSND